MVFVLIHLWSPSIVKIYPKLPIYIPLTFLIAKVQILLELLLNFITYDVDHYKECFVMNVVGKEEQ